MDEEPSQTVSVRSFRLSHRMDGRRALANRLRPVFARARLGATGWMDAWTGACTGWRLERTQFHDMLLLAGRSSDRVLWLTCYRDCRFHLLRSFVSARSLLQPMLLIDKLNPYIHDTHSTNCFFYCTDPDRYLALRTS
jgi:hypothetical protein